MALKFKKLEWALIDTHGGKKWYASAIGLEWRFSPVGWGKGDAARLEQEQEKAQAEYEAMLAVHIAEYNPEYDNAPIITADDKGNVTLTTPTAKDRVIDHLIQEHKRLSEDHRRAAEDGRVGLTQQQRERLKSIETALAIAVKDGDVVSDKPQEKK